jgi:nitric oxide reductase NorQ protein
MNKTKLELSRLPSGQLIAAANANRPAGLPVISDKAQAIEDLVARVEQGFVTMDEIRRARAVEVSTKAPEVNEALVRVDAAQSQVNAAIAELNQRLRSVDSQAVAVLEKAQRDVAAKLAQVRSSDTAEIQNTIQAEIAKAFDAFKRDKTEEQLIEIASALPSFTVARAGDVFPVTVYGTVDFSDLPVQVWGDSACPQIVKDYVFNPAHLHQALIALDDPLPDNVWLAGERGTGKTEFVTQLAARLQRRLVRVNFDEALERADFIGANTIQDGSVVWAEGIITRAIQTPGALILLDEVGFARAQSISVLHALTERSPHRALTIAETGARIPVAQYVTFFAADNSNGHGDSNGTFAGVREQNTAFLDRFGFTLRFEYLDAVDEADLIVRRTGLSLSAAQILVDFAGAARQQASNGLLTQPPSLRQLFAWARAVAKGLPVDIAFRNAIINKFPAECEGELTALYSARVNEQVFQGAL